MLRWSCYREMRRPTTELLYVCWALSLALALALEGTSSDASTVGGSDSWDIHHPLDRGLWADPPPTVDVTMTDLDEDMKKQNLDDKGLVGLRNVLRMAEIDSLRLFSKTPLPPNVMKPMNYGIFQTGQSALRSLPDEDRHLVLPQNYFGERTLCGPAHYRVCAALLLLRGYSDAAHEILLGVTMENLEEGEYAATHRGQTDWAQQHPLTDSADILHAAIHRIVEGNELGEGDQTGYDNARYWLAGGPKLLDSPAPHPVREALARIAKAHAPQCVAQGGVISKGDDSAKHVIPSGGGATRTVCVPCAQWDDYAFLKLCKLWSDGSLKKDLEDEVATLQRAEIMLFLRHELMECLGRYKLDQE